MPDPDCVTAQDVAMARELAEAVTRYVAELDRLAAVTQDTTGSEAHAERAA